MFKSLFATVLVLLMMIPSHMELQAAEIQKPSFFAGQLEQPKLWRDYKARFVKADGRVVDNANGNISHSEGQGYGMLLALAASDRETFDSIFGFARRNLSIRNDHLFAWRYDPSAKTKVADRNNASDGDLLIAWALLEAAEAGWNDEYRKDGLKILHDIEPLLISNLHLGLMIKPGSEGFTDENNVQTINPSYWVFPALERIYKLTGNPKWRRLVHSGHYLVEQLLERSERGLPDWAIVEPTSSNADFHPKKSSAFGYEAIRVPLYLMMGDKAGHELAFRLLKDVVEENKPGILQVNAKSGKVTGRFSSRGYLAISSLADCLQDQTRFNSAEIAKLDDLYYPATLQLFAILAASKENRACL